MNYKTIFAIENGLKDFVGNDSNGYMLKNYDHLGEKLISDFYLKYFIREVLFDKDIMEVDDFLEFQYTNSEEPDRFIKVLKLKVIPKIGEIIKLNQPDLDGISYPDCKKLEDGFMEDDYKIFNPLYEDDMLMHYAYVVKAEADLISREHIISEFIDKVHELGNSQNKGGLKWIAGPSKLAVLVRILVDGEYIEAPTKKDGEINLTQLANLILQSFDFEGDNPPVVDTLRRYLDTESEKNVKLMERFKDSDFHMPNANLV